MSDPSDSAAGGRRRSSVIMYDPARDLFQPTTEPLAHVLEESESTHSSKSRHTQEQVMGSSPRSSRIPSTTMASEAGKKRQRSPSPILGEKGRGHDIVISPPPEKKRRSLVSDAAASPAGEKSVSTSMPTASELVSSTSEIERSTIQEGKTRGGHSLPKPRRGQDHYRSPRRTASPPSNDKHGADHDRSRATDRDSYWNGDRGQRPRSRQRYRNGDRYTPPPRRSRSRSPTRRRSPKPSASSAYGRRDPAPPPRRSRSPSPIRRTPPREDEQIRRPGGGFGRGRNVLAVAQRLAEEREREQQARNNQVQRERGVQHMSNQFYNARPEWVKERGREWRKNESKIKGLRAFNNWIKSCIIQKFSPEEAPQAEELGWGEEPKALAEKKPLLVLDIGCGKGGDLGKWQLAPQNVALYVGLDPADQSIEQAHDRYVGMRRGRKPIFDARFHVKDCFGEWIGDIPIVREVGIDPNAGDGGPSKWSGGGFDIVTMMFSMHYAFESEQKARTMLRNVAGSLKKGGRFIGVVPNSDAISEQVVKWCKGNQDSSNPHLPKVDPHHPSSSSYSSPPSPTNAEKPKDEEKAIKFAVDSATLHWGNSLYSVRFGTDRPVPADGIFRDPPFGWKYMYWMEEAVDVPEYVVPWEAFRAVAEGYNLEQRYRKPFLEIWDAEKDGGEMRELSWRMGVRKAAGKGATTQDGRGGGGEGEGELGIGREEREAVAFYHAFCFVKV